MSTALQLAKVARHLTGHFTFRKRLPVAFGGAAVWVTSRSDVRLLAPGLSHCAQDLLLVAQHCVRSGDCVWDLGSNLGLFAFSAAWKAGANGRVFTLEPDPFYAELQHRTARHLPSGYATVSPLCAAVADKVAIVDLAIPKRGHARNHLKLVAGNDAGEIEQFKQVVTVTSDVLLSQWAPPDFVKLDIEGAELLFFTGSSALLSAVRPSFYVEVNDDHRQAVTSLLRSHDYVLSELTPDGAATRVDRCAFNTLAEPVERQRVLPSHARTGFVTAERSR